MLFCITVFFQDNPKLVEARFVWWVVGGHFFHLESFPEFFVFLINFIAVIFEAGNETREKNWSDFGAEQKLRADRKESCFLLIPLFLREREIDVWKDFL